MAGYEHIVEKYSSLADADEVDRFVREVSNTVHDPCGMAAGIAMGMDEMGLIRRIDAERDDEGRWQVHALVRLTSPGCEYFFAFRDNLQERASAHPQVSEVEVEWDPTLDWTPEALTPEARERWQNRQREIWGVKTVVPLHVTH